MVSVTLTFTATDEAEAQEILAAVARVRRGGDETLLGPGDEPPPGHTYRELCDARRAGLLAATMTTKGLVFTAGALDAYRAKRAERRSRKKASNVADLSERRIAALEKGGLRKRG